MADPTTPPTTTMKKSELKALLAQANISDPAAVIAAVSSAAPTGDSAAAQAPLTMKKSELLAALEGRTVNNQWLIEAGAGAGRANETQWRTPPTGDGEEEGEYDEEEGEEGEDDLSHNDLYNPAAVVSKMRDALAYAGWDWKVHFEELTCEEQHIFAWDYDPTQLLAVYIEGSDVPYRYVLCSWNATSLGFEHTGFFTYRASELVDLVTSPNMLALIRGFNEAQTRMEEAELESSARQRYQEAYAAAFAEAAAFHLPKPTPPGTPMPRRQPRARPLTPADPSSYSAPTDAPASSSAQ